MHSEMKKIISILLTICAFNICVKAQETGEESFPRFTFGAEWGYVATVWEFTHNNFFSAEGYRINEKGNAFGYHSNGELYLHAGYNFDEYWNLSLYAGYGGVNGMHKIVPISKSHEILRRWSADGQMVHICRSGKRNMPQEACTGDFYRKVRRRIQGVVKPGHEA